MSLADIGASDFESNNFFSSTRNKNFYSDTKIPDISSLANPERNSITRFPKVRVPLEQLKTEQDSFTSLNNLPVLKSRHSHNAAPKVSRKLPAAFATFTKSISGDKKTSFSHNMFVPPSHEPIDALEHMVNAQEYKYTKGLLSPIPNQQTPKKLEQEAFFNLREDKHRPSDLPPSIKDYMVLSKPNEDSNVYFDLGMDKPRKLYRGNKGRKATRKETFPSKPLSLSEMITLQIIKSSHETGIVKKMIHGPTLKLVAVKEVPLVTRESRNNLKLWLDLWQSELKHSKHHLQIYTTYFNVPEGCLSIIMELSNGGSLQNLLDSVSTIPESALRTVASQTLKALKDLHTKLNTSHGVVCPSQILLDKKGNVKLSLGLAHKLQSSGSGLGQANETGRFTFEKSHFLDKPPVGHMNVSPRGAMASKDIKKGEEGIAQDIFDLGLLLLKCAIGDLDMLGTDFTSKVKMFLDEYSKKPQERHRYCCVIHDDEAISSYNLTPTPRDSENSKSKSKKENQKCTPNRLSVKDLLMTGKFSKEFIEFLCYCLKFDSKQRHTASSLLASSFIKEHKVGGPMTSLVEILQTSNQVSKNYVLPAKYQAASEKQLDKLCNALSVMLSQPSPSSESIKELDKLTADSQVIQDLACDLGLPPVKVWKKLTGIINEI